MTALDLSALRAIAGEATPGPWVTLDMGGPEYTSSNDEGWWWVWQQTRLPYYGGVLEPERHTPDCPGKPSICCTGGALFSANITDNNDGVQEKADAEFVAAFNPQTVLALLDRLEAAEAERDALAAKVAAVEARVTRYRQLYEQATKAAARHSDPAFVAAYQDMAENYDYFVRDLSAALAVTP